MWKFKPSEQKACLHTLRRHKDPGKLGAPNHPSPITLPQVPQLAGPAAPLHCASSGAGA